VALALFTASSCYRAEINLSDLMDDMMQAGTASNPAGIGGSAGGTGAGDAPGGGGSAGDANENTAGQGGASEPPCRDEPLEPEQQVCFNLGAPSAEQCQEQDPMGWSGCYADTCHVCREALVGYPYYFDWHPCCQVNPTCYTHALKPHACDARCPEPTDRDRSPRCGQISIEL
jgi:hypothetical protein